MSGFAVFITSLSAACVFIGALQLICPDGAMEKPVKYILSLVFLVSVISTTGLITGGLNEEIDFNVSREIESEELYISSAKYVYETALRSAQINFSKITVCTDKLSDNSIVISKLVIYSDCESIRIMDALGNAAKNIEVEIINE